MHQFVLALLLLFGTGHTFSKWVQPSSGREKTSINHDCKFWRSERNPDGVIYDYRPDLANLTDVEVLKPYVLPSGNDFISNPANRHERPGGNPSTSIAYVEAECNDETWENVTLPHDWAIQGPFYTGEEGTNPINGGMGRWPVQGVGWYRRKLFHGPADLCTTIYLDIEGAMSYAMVWLNGHLIGGWPYGYNSSGSILRHSARWYPGAGLYRTVWLTKVNEIHVAQYGTYITTRDISSQAATIDLVVHLESASSSGKIRVKTDIHEYSYDIGAEVAKFPVAQARPTSSKVSINSSVTISTPNLWKPLPEVRPALYVAITRLYHDRNVIDTYETTFGFRSLDYNANEGLLVNGEVVKVQGVNQHHDLGALGAAFNVRAAERQLEVLKESGCDAIRMSHNPPATQLLELTDRMGFLVLNEIFDTWEFDKIANDFHLIFPDWHEPDLRAFIRRDRNHPSIIAWSYGNEVYEQYTDETGAALSASLRQIVHEEDPKRLSIVSMNYAMPNMSFSKRLEIISLNYQGDGIRDIEPPYLPHGIVRPPSYPRYHSTFPYKMIWSTEIASTLSSRGIYTFPVTNSTSAPVNTSTQVGGTDNATAQVSAYELYTANFGSSPDKVFLSQDRAP